MDENWRALRLLYGNDRRNPKRVLELNNSGIFLRTGGSGPGPGKLGVTWTGASPRHDGQRRVSSRRDNAHYTLTYSMADAESTAYLGWLQGEIDRFFEECGLYEETQKGEPVWLEYRWPDGLGASVPAPAFGQLSSYMRVLAGDVPEWPKALPWLRAGAIEGLAADLTCEPTAKGLPQTAGKAIGQVEPTAEGVLVPYAVTNVCTNPSFGHATWNTGWTASDAALKATHETRGGFYRSLKSAVHLFNLHAAAQTYTQTLTLTAVSYIISCSVRREDGEAPTAEDVKLWGQGGALTPTFVEVEGGPWHLAYATFTGAAVSSTHGVQVQIGREVIVDDVQIALAGNFTTPLPFCAGYRLGCTWASTAHASSSSRVAAVLKWTLTDELMGEYAAGGWVVPHWTNAGPAADLSVWEYWVDANNNARVHYDYTNDRFEVEGSRNGSAFSGTGAARTIAMFQPIHILAVQDTTTLKVYVNGAEDISVAVALGMPTGGTFALGCSTQAAMAITGAVDGWRIWRQAPSATEAAAVYAAELPIKGAHGMVCPIPFGWSAAGDGVVSNHDDAAHDNWMAFGGMPGDTDAETEWHISPAAEASAMRGFWMARMAVEEALRPTEATWLEFQGTGNAGSSEGEYGSVALSGVDSDVLEATVSKPEAIRGAVRVLARMQVSGANTLTITPYWGFGTTYRVYGKSFSIAAGAGLVLRDLGTLDIDWIGTPNTLTVGLLAEQAAAGSTSLLLDFIELLPSPACKAQAVESAMTVTAGDVVVIGEREAEMRTSAGQPNYKFEHGGDAVSLAPFRLNYVTLTRGENGAAFNIASGHTIAVMVTPRWKLGGGRK